MEIKVKQKEAKTLTFTIKQSGSVVDVSSATMSFQVKENKSDTSTIISKADGDFDKTNGASGIVTVALSTTDLDQTAGAYVAELQTQISASNIDKSVDIDFTIESAVIS